MVAGTVPDEGVSRWQIEHINPAGKPSVASGRSWPTCVPETRALVGNEPSAPCRQLFSAYLPVDAVGWATGAAPEPLIAAPN